MFKKESDNLNKNYNKLFKGINLSVKIICDDINGISPIIIDFQNEIEEGREKTEEILENFNSEEDYETFKSNFNKLKDLFNLIKNKKDLKEDEMKKLVKNLESQYKLRKSYFDSVKSDSNKIIVDLTQKSDSIKNDIVELRKKLAQQPIEIPQINISDIIVENILKSFENSVELIKKENDIIRKGIKEIKIIFSILDLLFIMDNTGSMEGYFDILKKNLIDIIDKIKEKAPQIEINFGYIGYKDIKQIINNECKLISFTSDYNFIKEEINEITIGGGDDTAEDVAWGLEQAIKLEWNGNVKFAILIADAPCHGLNYHDKNIIDNYIYGVPGRKKIEDSIKEMMEKEISLFCIELNESTDKMYKIIEEIYNEKKEDKKCTFLKVKINKPQDLVDQIVNKSSIIYETYSLK